MNKGQPSTSQLSHCQTYSVFSSKVSTVAPIYQHCQGFDMQIHHTLIKNALPSIKTSCKGCVKALD